jgi:uncharacterized protein YyaL (SSP411 family)
MTDPSNHQPAAAGDHGPRNRLAQEKSPYLLQHAGNPVDWYPWCDEAFATARARDVPIFLSIGYATCHWCHVMERESFEDPAVAALMNEAFVNVKVDREERPDIDQVYMTVCQMLSGSGGWPLTIVMTPDATPFFAATYLPRESVSGRIGMLDLVPRIQQLWRDDRERVLSSALQIVAQLHKAGARHTPGELDGSVLDRTFRQLAERYDERHGGFGDRPKFPSPHNLLFLTDYWRRTGEDRALAMVEHTLEAMRLGGIYDHIGFGFHRYSTDSEWLVPHFEKMLYDQAMMILASCEAFRASGRPLHRRTAAEVIEYVRRDMTAPAGGFYSAEDADSEGEEGRFYLWTMDELEDVLTGEQIGLITDLFRVGRGGNFLDEATRRPTGTNILHMREGHGAAATRLGLGGEAFEERLQTIRRILFEVRTRREHPLKDDKILADWNGLMASAMARAGWIFKDNGYLETARRALDFVLGAMRSGGGRLHHRFRDGRLDIPGFLDDYAFVTWACLEVYRGTHEVPYLDHALRLQDETLARFWDHDGDGGFFFTADDAETLLVRQKETYDGAIPSGNSVAAFNMVRLARLTGRTEYRDRASALFRAFAAQVARQPSAHSHLMSALQLERAPSIEIVIAGAPGASDTSRLIDVVRSTAPPGVSLLVVTQDAEAARLRELAPFAAGYGPVDGRAAAYVCRDHACQLPTTDPDAVASMLRDMGGIS